MIAQLIRKVEWKQAHSPLSNSNTASMTKFNNVSGWLQEAAFSEQHQTVLRVQFSISLLISVENWSCRDTLSAAHMQGPAFLVSDMLSLDLCTWLPPFKKAFQFQKRPVLSPCIGNVLLD